MNEKEYLQKIQKAKKYYAQFDINEPTIGHWRQWLDTLPKDMSGDFYEKGSAYSFKSIPFQAWYLGEIKGMKQDW